MSITSLPFEFEYKGKQVQGECTIIDLPGNTTLPYQFPLFRVSLNNHRIKPDIYLFYKTASEGQPFFWYKNSGKNNAIFEAISKELERNFLKNWYSSLKNKFQTYRLIVALQYKITSVPNLLG